MLTNYRGTLCPRRFSIFRHKRLLDDSSSKTSPRPSKLPEQKPVPLGTRLEDIAVSDTETLRYILKHVWPKSAVGRLQTLGSLGFIAVSKTAQGRTPALMARFIDMLSDSKLLSEGDSEDWSAILKCAALIAGSRAVSIFSREMRGALYARVINSANKQMASELYSVLQNSHIHFLLQNPPGELATLVLTSSRALGGILSNLNQRAIPIYWDIAQMITKLRQLQKRTLVPTKKRGSRGFAKPDLPVQISSDIVKIAKLTLVSYFLFSFLYGEFRVQERIKLTESDINVRGGMLESLQNVEVVQASHASAKEVDKFNKLYEDYEDKQAKVQSSLATMNIVQGFILRSGMLASTLVVSDKIFRGLSKVGALTSTQHIFDGLIHPLNFVGTMYREFKSNFRDVQSGLRLLKIPQVQDSPYASELRVNKGSIQLRDVTFSYPTRLADGEEEASVKNINLSISGKSTVAIVGPSGSGKSTLLRLLLRFYEPTTGQIGICGQPINQVTLKSLRNSISLVSQETLLFNTTLRENLLYGCAPDQQPTEEEFEQAIQDTGLNEVVKKIGLDGKVGERGQALSGGERQRVAIARAMLRKSPIVLFDEPTSGLDAVNEQLVMKAIRKLKGKSTVIIVAHKLATVIDGDEIIYLEGGIIKERGSHEQLLVRNGLYAKLWDAQAGGDDSSKNIARRTYRDALKDQHSFCSASGSGCCHD